MGTLTPASGDNTPTIGVLLFIVPIRLMMGVNIPTRAGWITRGIIGVCLVSWLLVLLLWVWVVVPMLVVPMGYLGLLLLLLRVLWILRVILMLIMLMLRWIRRLLRRCLKIIFKLAE